MFDVVKYLSFNSMYPVSYTDSNGQIERMKYGTGTEILSHDG